MSRQGCLIISLDFELYWGMLGAVSQESFARNIDETRTSILKILELFEAYRIHATWATVGFLFFKSKSELSDSCPTIRPNYIDTNLCPYIHIEHIGNNELSDCLHYAPSLIGKISETPGQEIASHTFSHFYCHEDSVGLKAFATDLDTAIIVANNRGFQIQSIVFPRNQIRPDYLEVCANRGIVCYRGNPDFWPYRNNSKQGVNLLRRVIRLADSYFNIWGHNCYFIEDSHNYPLNLPASRLFRPVTVRCLEQLRVKRVMNDLTYAAKEGLCYHLWWHPHNFGKDMNTSLDSLEKVLMHIEILRNDYELLSLNMLEAANFYRGSYIEREVASL